MEGDLSPVVSVDGCHHECCPAKSVPCIDISTFRQQPRKREKYFQCMAYHGHKSGRNEKSINREAR